MLDLVGGRVPREEREEKRVDLWDGLFSVDVKIEEHLHQSRAFTRPSYVWGNLVPGMLHSAQHNPCLTITDADEITHTQMKVPVIRSWASTTLVILPLRKVWGKSLGGFCTTDKALRLRQEHVCKIFLSSSWVGENFWVWQTWPSQGRERPT